MRTYALVGKPLSHSFSQKYFREKFATLGIEADYLLKELPMLCHIREMIVRMPTLQGFNVTYNSKVTTPTCTDFQLLSKNASTFQALKEPSSWVAEVFRKP